MFIVNMMLVVFICYGAIISIASHMINISSKYDQPKTKEAYLKGFIPYWNWVQHFKNKYNELEN